LKNQSIRKKETQKNIKKNKNKVIQSYECPKKGRKFFLKKKNTK